MFDEYVKDGAYPSDLEGYYDEDAEEVLYDVTFSPNPPRQAFQARHDMNTATYQRENARLRGQGYSLAIHSAFRDGDGALMHAAVWTKRA